MANTLAPWSPTESTLQLIVVLAGPPAPIWGAILSLPQGPAILASEAVAYISVLSAQAGIVAFALFDSPPAMSGVDATAVIPHVIEDVVPRNRIGLLQVVTHLTQGAQEQHHGVGGKHSSFRDLEPPEPRNSRREAKLPRANSATKPAEQYLGQHLFLQRMSQRARRHIP